MEFQKIKDQYEQQRKAERSKLIAYLEKHALFTNAGLTVVKGGGSGRKSIVPVVGFSRSILVTGNGLSAKMLEVVSMRSYP